MPHTCKIATTQNVVTNRLQALGENSLNKRFLKLRLVSEKNPLTSLYFKSDKAILSEKLRQINTGYFVIHPLSKFRQYYELWALFLYLAASLVKPLDSGTQRFSFLKGHLALSVSVDFATAIDVIMSFCTGFIISKTKTIELRRWYIAKHYMFGPFFLTDVLGSLKFIHYPFISVPIPNAITGCFNIFCLLRAIRIWSVMSLVSRLGSVFRMKSKVTWFTISSIILMLFTVHFFTCFLISSRIFIRYHFGVSDPYGLAQNLNIYDAYINYTFRSSAYLLGIGLPSVYYEELRYTEDYIVAIFTYTVGKLLLISTWIIMALSILTTKSTSIKYQKVMQELDEYMIQRQLPLNLRRKITMYYDSKYQGSYFKEDLINFLISENLRKEISMGICKSLVETVSIFKGLSQSQISEIVQALKPEIFLPNDLIIQSGTEGEAMYFLASGTVAVSTHSGKEVCHLQDGAYFGEISLILKGQKRSANVSAVEICHVYKLNKLDFQKTLMRHKKTFKIIVSTAEKRLLQTIAEEDLYKKMLFEKTHDATQSGEPKSEVRRKSNALRVSK